MIKSIDVKKVIQQFPVGTIFEIHWGLGSIVECERAYDGWIAMGFYQQGAWKSQKAEDWNIFKFKDSIGSAEAIISHGMKFQDQENLI
jgi:hypothetical protein